MRKSSQNLAEMKHSRSEEAISVNSEQDCEVILSWEDSSLPRTSRTSSPYDHRMMSSSDSNLSLPRTHSRTSSPYDNRMMGSSDSMDSVVDLEKSGISTMPTVHEQQAGEWDHYVETESSFVRDDLDQVDQAPQTPGAVGRVPEKPKFPRNYSKYNPDSGNGEGTLISNRPIDWDPASLAIVEKVYVKMVIAVVFIALVSPLCVRYLMTTTAGEEKPRDDGGSLSLSVNPDGRWAQDFTPVELALVFVAVMGNFANIVKWITVLSGYPNSPMNGLSVELEGHVVIGTCTPILGESDAVFLRSLLGRHCMSFHTVVGRHNVEGLYMDIFANEQRSRSDKNVRQNQWCAWVEFLRFLSEIKLEDMNWYENPRRKEGSGFFDHDPNISRHSSDLQKLIRIGSSQSLLSLKSFSTDTFDELSRDIKKFSKSDTRNAQVPYATTRCIRVSDDQQVMYDLEKEYAFHGVQEIAKKNNRNKSSSRSNLASVSEDDYFIEGDLEDMEPIDEVDDGINVYEILPMLTFLDVWLERVKANDPDRDNNNNMAALKDIFNSAPCTNFFTGAIQLSVQNRLRELFEVFARTQEHIIDHSKFINLTGEKMSEGPIHRDEVTEAVVKIRRDGMKDWNLVFAFASRGKLVKGTEEDEYAKVIMDKTEIIKGSIVYYEQDELQDWFHSRKYGTYKVSKVRDNNTVDMEPWPSAPKEGADVESSNRSGESCRGVSEVNIQDLHLYCGQRGKAGALHFAMDYLRKRGHEWAEKLPKPPANRVKTIFSVIDARHMITEPHIYFNNALPHFARGPKMEDIKGYAPKQDVYLVQYPQHYADVKDNTWNGRNLIHWTLSQFIQDYARCCVSTGSNSLWDISPKGFDFLPLAASCRVDDTAATLSHIKEKIIVHMPVFCSMGVSRPKVNDMLDTWTRWAAGNVELSWILITSKYVREYGFCHGLYMLYMAANFLPSSIAYVAWVLFIFAVFLWSFKENADGRLPFRDISSVLKYWECATFSVDRTTQFIPILAVLLNVAIYFQIPLLSSDSRAFFWVIWVGLVRMPTLFLTDKTIDMLRVFNTKCAKDKLSFSAAVWDGLVFEMSAQPLGLLALFEGTYQGLNAAIFNLDITFWNATGVKQSVVNKKYLNMTQHTNKLSLDWIVSIAAYIDVRLRSFYVASRSPRMAITVYISFILIANFFLMGYIWYMTTDRTLLFCSFLSFFFNCAVFSAPWKRLVTPLRYFWSFDYNFEYFFLPLTIALILFVGKGVFFFRWIYDFFA